MYEKREVQQENLVKAAYELAAEKGIGALRTRAIASKAGVSVGTLHYCFKTKEDLLRALYFYVRAEFRENLDGILYGKAAPPEENLSSMMKARLHMLENEPMAFRVWRAFTREAWTDETVKAIVKEHLAEQRARFQAMLVRGADSGELSGPLLENPRISAALLWSIYEGLIVQWSIDPDAFTLGEYSLEIMRLCGHGVKDEAKNESEQADDNCGAKR